jgi:PmbA protein
MTRGGPQTAFRVADALRGRLEAPWEVYGEHLRRFEIHLSGDHIEMIRGPLEMEGYGLRLLRRKEGTLGIGFSATSDLSTPGIERTVELAEATASHARFPAPRAELPSSGAATTGDIETVDARLWNAPFETLESYAHQLLSQFDGRRTVVPSFGSIKATLSQSTISNSQGLERGQDRTTVEFEFAVKASGGPEGAPPGEYWVVRRQGSLPTDGVASEVDHWCRQAEAIRRAGTPNSGPQKVIFPAHVLADVLPAILGFRLSGAARLRKIMPEPGTEIGSEKVTIWDDPTLPFGVGSGAFDDEGSPHSRRAILEHGKVVSGLYDALHGAAFDLPSTGNASRDGTFTSESIRFAHSPQPGTSNLSWEPGDGGTDEELIEAVGEGIWLEQLGYAFPDAFSGAFGGEIRVGYRIEHGKLGEPIRGGIIGGLLFGGPGEPSLLRSVTSTGSRARTEGSLRAPSVVVDPMTVAGGTGA